VTFTVDAYPERTFVGKVVNLRRAPEVYQNVVAYTAVIASANEDQALFPGMVATLQIAIDDSGEVLKIPNQALRFRPKDPGGGERHQDHQATGNSVTVWTLGQDGKPLPVPVNFGVSDDYATQLLSGKLGEGDRVIVGVSARETRLSLLNLQFWK